MVGLVGEGARSEIGPGVPVGLFTKIVSVASSCVKLDGRIARTR